MYKVYKETSTPTANGYTANKVLIGQFDEMDHAFDFSDYWNIKNTDLDVMYFVITPEKSTPVAINNAMITNVLKWLGCIMVCAGALATSLRVDPLNIYLLNLGAIVYLAWAVRIGELNLIVVNTVLLGIYLVGLLYQV
jgi:hypothetical protein